MRNGRARESRYLAVRLRTLTVVTKLCKHFSHSLQSGRRTGQESGFSQCLHAGLHSINDGRFRTWHAAVRVGHRCFTDGTVGAILSREQGNSRKWRLGILRACWSRWNPGVPRFILHTVQATLGGGCAGMENVPVLTEPTGVPDEFYGNIGQSALKSFSSFTIDFITMSFSVSGRKPYACPVDN